MLHNAPMTDQTFEYIVAVAILIFKEDKVLTLMRSPNKDASPLIWESISGRLLEEENPYDAALREVEEECGLEVSIDPRPVDAYKAKRLGRNMILIVYKAEYLSGEVTLSSEHDQFAWRTVEEFETITPLKALIKAAKKVRSYDRS